MANRTCSIDGCERPHEARSWCGKHYRRWRTTGDPQGLVLRRYTGRRMMVNGYVAVWAPGHPVASSDNYALEHRLVAYDAGLLTDLNMHVHHIDGDKTNNAVENLEVLTKSEHHRRHIAEAGVVENQYGLWPVRSSR